MSVSDVFEVKVRPIKLRRWAHAGWCRTYVGKRKGWAFIVDVPKLGLRKMGTVVMTVGGKGEPRVWRGQVSVLTSGKPRLESFFSSPAEAKAYVEAVLVERELTRGS